MAAATHRLPGSIAPRRRGVAPPQAPDEKSPWTKKLAVRNEYGRDVDSPSERERARTTWLRKPQHFTGAKDFAGYVPLPHSWFADLMRIKRGAVQMGLLLYGWSQSYGRERKGSETPAPATPDLSIAALAQIMCCTERQIEDDLADGHERKLIKLTRVGPKIVHYELMFWCWEGLPDYRAPERKPAASADEIHTGSENEDPSISKSSEPVVLLKKPAYVRAGRSSRPVPVTTGVKAFRLVNECAADLGLDAVVICGELLLTARFGNASPIAINNLVSKSGSTLPDETFRRFPAAIGSKKYQPSEVNNLASKSGSTLPSIDEADIQAVVQRILGYGIETPYARALAASVPAACPLEFIGAELQERSSASTPLTDRKLKPWFSESLPHRWKLRRDAWLRRQAEDEHARAVASRTDETSARQAEIYERAEQEWGSLDETERTARLMRATEVARKRHPNWKKLAKDQQARLIDDAAFVEFRRELENEEGS